MSRVPLGRLEIDLVALTEKFISGLSAAETRLDKFAERSKKSIGELGEKMTIGLTAPLTAGALAAVAASDTITKAMNTLRAQTGATGGALAELGRNLRDIAAKSDASFAQIAQVQAELSRSAKLSGDALKGVTEAVLEMSEKLGGDAVAASKGAAQALKLYRTPLGEIDETLGQLALSQQKYGVAVQDTLADLASSGPIFQAYRLNLAQSIDLIGRLRASGVEPGGLTRGLRGLAANMVEKGIDPRAQLDVVIEGLRKVSSEAQAAGDAMAIFGDAAGVQLAAAVRTGGLSLEKLGEAAGKGKEALYGFTDITDSLGEMLDKLRNKATLAIEPIGVKLVKSLEDLLPLATDLLDRVASFAKWFAELSPQTQKIIVAVAVIGPALSAISTAIVGIAAAGGLILTLFSPITLGVAGIGVAVYLVWKYWDDITGFVKAIPGYLSYIWASIQLTGLKAIAELKRFALEAVETVLAKIRPSAELRSILAGMNAGALAGAGGLALSTLAAGAPIPYEQIYAADMTSIAASSAAFTAAGGDIKAESRKQFPDGTLIVWTPRGPLFVDSRLVAAAVAAGKTQAQAIAAMGTQAGPAAAAAGTPGAGVMSYEALLASRRQDPGRDAALSLAQSFETPDEKYMRMSIALSQAAKDYPNIITPDLLDRGLTKYLQELFDSRKPDDVAERKKSILKSVVDRRTDRRALLELRSQITGDERLSQNPVYQDALIDVRRQLAALGDDAVFQLKDRIGGALENLGQQFSSEFGKMLVTGKGTFEDLATSFVQMLATIVTQTLIAEPIVRSFKQLIGVAYSDNGGSQGGGGGPEGPPSPFQQHALGNVFSGGRVVPFAAGGVAWSPRIPTGLITRPTLFPMANGGTGLAGEAGPEVGIAPLERIGGRLGVRSTVPNVLVQVVDQRQGGARPEVQESRSSDGQRVIRVLIRDEVRNAIAEGAFDRQLSASFPSVTRRPPAR